MSPASRNSAFLPEHGRLNSRRQNLWIRASLTQSIRRFFIERNYLEVETPQIIPAPAPEAHIDAVRTETGYLHTSPELCMKRMLSAGFPKIFQLARCFRANERGDRHLPEFCLLEWYRTGIDYHDLMAECKDLLLHVFQEVKGDGPFQYQGRAIDLNRAWHRITVAEAFLTYAETDVFGALGQGRFDEIMAFEIEPRLGPMGPVFLYDYPIELGALARTKPGDPRFAERFELYLCGMELANGFSELTDVVEQRHRFQAEGLRRQERGKAAYPIPERFLSSLCHMPDSAGIALGVDRLAMILCDRPKIDDVSTFTPEEL